jgi:hypothetical protein
MDDERVPEPGEGDERSLLLGWLAFHRDAMRAKARGLSPEQLTTPAVPPSPLTILGLVRHLVEMERVYGGWAIGGAAPLEFVWGEYVEGGPDWDFEVDAAMAGESLAAWSRERAATDVVLAATGDLDVVGTGNGRTARWNLHKLIGEYARHNGHADLIRERLDGVTGE